MRIFSSILVLINFVFIISCDLAPAISPDNVTKKDVNKVISDKTDHSVLEVSIKAESSSVTVNNPAVFFVSYIKNQNNIAHVYFDFDNDGTIDMEYNNQITNSIYTYTDPGVKTVKIIVIDDQNYMDTKTVQITVD